MTDNEVRRDPRLRLACARCQRRKIRCDGQYPTCSNCRKAAAECVDGGSLRLRSGPHDPSLAHGRALTNKLRRRVSWLESIIRERLPDVDLSSTPSHDEIEGPMAENAGTADSSASTLPQERRENLIPDLAAVQPAIGPDQRAHEIGLISVGFNADQKYIGPSSGYFLARLLLANSRKTATGDLENRSSRSTAMPQLSIDELVSAAQGPLPLPPQRIATQLCQVYFEIIQPQYPILHELSFRTTLAQVYHNADTGDVTDDAVSHFQVYMVLAISASISTWRTKRQVPGESYCLSALQYFDRISVGTSLAGLQSVLLLLIFTMYSPHMQLNVWNLNYQCLAAVVDLGLQRKVTTSAGISLLEQEMRTRIFWTVFTIDRTVASMMGRPIGLRDEACELRLPQLLSDAELIHGVSDINNQGHSMAVSIHLFQLAKLNSEIKYVANSIVRDVPSYAYPAMRDVSIWQGDMCQRLEEWIATIPQTQSPNEYIRLTSQLRGLSVKMLLLRPCPAIPKPTSLILTICHASARQSLELYEKLYKNDLIVYDWITLHGVVFSTITALYCTRAVPEIAQEMEPEDLMEDMSVSLSILSATGEHWSGAKRARDILEDVGRATIRWLRQSRRMSAQRMPLGQEGSNQMSATNAMGNAQVQQLMGGDDNGTNVSGMTSDLDFFSSIQLDLGFDPDMQQRQEPYGDTLNIDDMMRSLFEGFIPSGPSYF